MAQSATAKRVSELIRKPIEDLGYTLWDVRFVKEGASWYLRIFIDKEGGISITDCTDVSHAVDPVLDENDPISQSYYLEVCSPGVERQLIEPSHSAAMTGKKVKVKLIRPRDNVREFEGVLSAYDGSVTITMESGSEETFEKSEISSVRLNDSL